MMAGIRLGWLLVLLLLGGVADGAVRTWLDRQDIRMDETFTLNIEVDQVGASQPDLSQLEQNFELLGSSSSSEMSITNGARVARTLFAVALSPRRDGVITIPPITVDGQSSEPIVITVKPSAITGGAQGDVFLEAELSETNPYVQQQVLVTLRLFSVMQIQQGSLDLNIPDGVRAVRLGDDAGYRSTRGGRQYFVIERRFALVPERSGEFELGTARFEGLGLGRGGISGYFGGASRLRAVSEPMKLDVKAMPAGAAQPWLPALALELQGEPEIPATVRVGEPISYPISLSAEGLSVEQLPELTLSESPGLSIYPDQPSSRDRSSSKGLAAERSRRFAIVPSQAGELQIPALKIRWWDVAAGQERLAQLPARAIQVLPAAGTAPAPPRPATSPPESGTGISSEQNALAMNQAWPWMLLSLMLAMGWAWTAWHSRQKADAQPKPSSPMADTTAGSAALQTALRRALQEGDLPQIGRTLRAQSPRPDVDGLDRLATLLQDADQTSAVQGLQLALYGRSEEGLDELRTRLRQAFARGPRWRSAEDPQMSDQTLPPLYRSGFKPRT